jgi:hemerythrin-like domain-containing protein
MAEAQAAPRRTDERTRIVTTTLTDTDMDVMRILHSALRRDGARLERAAERYGTQDEEAHDALLLGWSGFSSSLHHHHTIEDTHIWPAIRAKLAYRPDDVAVLDAMEAEHSRIDPALEAVERAFDDREAGVDEVAGRITTLVELLRSHLGHEERDAFPLIHTMITRREWDTLTKASVKELGYSEIANLGPWILEGAPPDDVRTVLAELPPPLRLVHRFWWNPRYHKARRWE